MRYLVWTALVWVSFIVLAWWVADNSCDETRGFCFGPSTGEINAALFGISVLVYVLGLLVMWGLGRLSGRGRSR